MTTPGEALAASTAAGAEADARSADATTVSCEMVRVGLFFDGSGPSLADGGNPQSWQVTG
jgi:hypothetical protein